MAIPKGFKRVYKGRCVAGDYVKSIQGEGSYEHYAHGFVGDTISKLEKRNKIIVYRRPQKKKEKAMFQLLCEMDKHLGRCVCQSAKHGWALKLRKNVKAAIAQLKQ